MKNAWDGVATVLQFIQNGNDFYLRISFHFLKLKCYSSDLTH